MRVGRCEAEQDLYLLLGVTPRATVEQIRRAHKNLVRLHHPDRAGSDPESQRLAEQRMKAINHAASVLLNPQARLAYDTLRGHRRPAPRPAAPPPRAWYDAPVAPPSRTQAAATPSWFDRATDWAAAQRSTSLGRQLLVGAAVATAALALVLPSLGGPTPVASPSYRLRPEPVRVTMWAP